MNDELKKILKLIDEEPQRFSDKIPEIERQIFREVSVLLKDLKTDSSGRIIPSIENLNLVNSIKGRLGKIFVSKKYAEAVKRFVGSIPSIANQQIATPQLPAVSKKMISAVARQNIDNTLESLIGSGYKQNVVSKIQNVLLTSVTTGGSHADLIENLRNQIVSTDERAGMISRYAQTYVVNSLGQFAGQGNKMIADALNSEWFEYVGSNIETTREFCEHLTKKRYVHISEIPTLLDGIIDGHEVEINRNTGLPKGMIEGTTPENFIVYRGGWNCGHELIPVNEVSVPKAVRDKIKHKKNISKQDEEYVIKLLNEKQDGKEIYANKEKAIEFAKKHNLSNAERIAINIYTGKAYKDLNKELREGTISEKNKSFETILNSALDKLNPINDTIYRGVNLPESAIKNYIEAFNSNTDITEKAFTSTSFDKNVAIMFSKAVSFEIKSKTGRDITELSKFGWKESEVLFKSGTNFKVTGITQHQSGNYTITMEEVN